jgi:hypothetical protein
LGALFHSLEWGTGAAAASARNGADEVRAFLTMLATERKVSISTHNQALSALLFLYREVLQVQLPWLTDIQRPTRPARIRSVLTHGEVAAVLGALDGEVGLPACSMARACGSAKVCGFASRPATRHQAGLRSGAHLQAGLGPHASAFVRDPPVASGYRHPHRAGAAGSQRCEHDDDLHARAEGGRRRHVQPAGCAGAASLQRA